MPVNVALLYTLPDCPEQYPIHTFVIQLIVKFSLYMHIALLLSHHKFI